MKGVEVEFDTTTVMREWPSFHEYVDRNAGLVVDLHLVGTVMLVACSRTYQYNKEKSIAYLVMLSRRIYDT